MGETSARAYRADIDGLRALAILPVVAYHAGVPGFSGGYVGVDVFFVISGFLITQQLLQQQAGGGIDLLDFYARRVRRIVPLLAMVIMATLAAGLIFFSVAGEQQALAESAASAAGFFANFWFWRGQTGYFHARVDFLPLVHTWSLAVEEQFYLVWPLLLMAIGRRPRLLTAVLIAGTLASLALAQVLSQWRPAAAFFTTPTRAWELGAGALLALNGRRVQISPPAWPVLGALSVAAIVACAVTYNATTPFPGLSAVPAVVAAATLIAAGGVQPIPLTSRLLGWRPLAWIGRLSFGWYLWHWPMLAFARTLDLRRDPLIDGAVALSALGMAALSHRFIEQPIRLRRPGPFASRKGAVLAGVGLLTACAASAGLVYAVAEARLAAHPMDQALRAARLAVRYVPDACTVARAPLGPEPDLDTCLAGSKTARRGVLLLGDSHGAHLIPALVSGGQALDFNVLVRSQSGCRPEYLTLQVRQGVTAADAQMCAEFNQRLAQRLPELVRRYRLTAVVISARWSAAALDHEALHALVDRLRAAGLRVLITDDVPQFDAEAPHCLMHRPLSACTADRAKVMKTNARSRAVIADVAAGAAGVAVYDPLPALCGAAACSPLDGDAVLYQDNHHLTQAGALRLAPSLTAALRDLLAP